MEKPKDRDKHKPPMKSFEEAMPRCNRYTEGRTVTAAPFLCNMDLATIWRVKAPNLPKYAIAKTPGTKIRVLFSRTEIQSQATAAMLQKAPHAKEDNEKQKQI